MSKRVCLQAAALAVLMMGTGSGLSQPGSKDKVPAPPESSKESAITPHRNSSKDPADPDTKVIPQKVRDDYRHVAQFFAYSLTIAPYNGEDEIRAVGSIAKPSMRDFYASYDRLCTLPTVGNRVTVVQERYSQLFCEAMLRELKVVLMIDSRPIVRVNAVRMMASACKLPHPAMADALIELIDNDNTSDYLKHYAFQGLRNLLDQSPNDEPFRHIITDVNLLAKIAKSLEKYVTRTRTWRDDQEREVIEYVRFQAVSALSRIKYHTVRTQTKDPLHRPGIALMRILAADPVIVPPPTLQESVEATIGFVNMRDDPRMAPTGNDMNLDVAAYYVASHVARFASAAIADDNRPDKATATVLPWKVQAARMSYGLAQWRDYVKVLPDGPNYVGKMAEEAIRNVLGPIESAGSSGRTSSQLLAGWDKANPLKPTSIGKMTLFSKAPTLDLPIAAPAPPKKTPVTGKSN